VDRLDDEAALEIEDEHVERRRRHDRAERAEAADRLRGRIDQELDPVLLHVVRGARVGLLRARRRGPGDRERDDERPHAR